LLDLNLSGNDGYDVLKKAVSMPFFTIIVSAHTERAVKAFEFGVIDFIPKPFSMKRLRQAFDRYFGHIKIPSHMKYLVIQKCRDHILLPVRNVIYFKADRYLVEIHLENGAAEYVEKPLNQLERTLPDNFVRIHRSFIVNLHFVKSFQHTGSSIYRVQLTQGEELPLSRNRSRNFKNLFND
jgi:two-component system response regulator LytT